MKTRRLLVLMLTLAAFVLLLTWWEKQFKPGRGPLFQPQRTQYEPPAPDWQGPFSGESVDSLLKRLTSDEPEVKIKAAHALGHLRAPRAVTPLLDLLNDNRPEVVVAGLFALSKLKAKQAVEPSIKLLEYPNPRVRAMAAFAVGELGDKRAIGALNDALSDTDEATKYLAKRSLKKLLVLHKVRIRSR